MKYELVVVWYTGDTEIFEYNTKADAERGAENMKRAFGNQVTWTGTRPKRR